MNIALDQECEFCRGSGRDCDNYSPCKTCKGRGRVLTPAGEAMLVFVQNWLVPGQTHTTGPYAIAQPALRRKEGLIEP